MIGRAFLLRCLLQEVDVSARLLSSSLTPQSNMYIFIGRSVTEETLWIQVEPELNGCIEGTVISADLHLIVPGRYRLRGDYKPKENKQGGTARRTIGGLAVSAFNHVC